MLNNGFFNTLKLKLRKIKSFFHIGSFEIFFLVCCVIMYYGPTIFSHDGFYYFAQLISIFEDGDLYIYNNLESFPVETFIKGNEFSIGPAIFWAPFYLIGHLFLSLLSLIFPQVLSVFPEDLLIFGLDVGLCNLGTMFYAYLGLKLVSKTLYIYFDDKNIANFGAYFAFFCTPLIYYVFRLPMMAHAIGFFVIALLIYLWTIWHDVLNTKQIFIICFVLGLASLVRMQNVLYGVIFIPQVVKTIKFLKKDNTTIVFLQKLIFMVLIAGGTFLLTYSPQFIAWWVQFGAFSPPVYDEGDFRYFNPRFDEVLFGQHGFFIWHPLFILCVIGLLDFFMRKDSNKYDTLVFLLAFFLQSYLWAIWRNPDAGCSFGMRGLIECVPLMAIGLGNVIAWGNTKNRKATQIGLILVLIIFTLMNLYLFALLGYPYGDVYLRCGTPLDIGWFFNIDWELLGNTFIPQFPLEKIFILIGLSFSVLLANSFIKYLDNRKITTEDTVIDKPQEETIEHDES